MEHTPKTQSVLLQLGAANPSPALSVPSKLHSACNVLPDALAASESCIQRTIQNRVRSVLQQSSEKMFGGQR